MRLIPVRSRSSRQRRALAAGYNTGAGFASCALSPKWRVPEETAPQDTGTAKVRSYGWVAQIAIYDNNLMPGSRQDGSDDGRLALPRTADGDQQQFLTD